MKKLIKNIADFVVFLLKFANILLKNKVTGFFLKKTGFLGRTLFLEKVKILCYYAFAERASAGGKNVKKQSDKRLVFIDPKKILPPKNGRDTDRYRLFLLSESIREFGLIIPVTVYETSGGYRVMSGERRVKASIIAGVDKIPCFVTSAAFDPMLFRALEEQTGQSRDECDDAQLINSLCRRYSAVTVASVLSMTTGEVNKILQCRQKPEEKNLSIALVTQPAPEEKHTEKEAPAREKQLPPIRDVRFLVNSIKQLTESVVRGGLKADYKQKETEKSVEIRLRIEKEERRQISIF